MARLLLLVGAIATLAPLAFILRSGSGNSLQSGRLPGAAAILEAGSASAPPETESAVTALAPLLSPDASLGAGVAVTSPATTVTAPVTQPAATPPPAAATTSFECPKVYEVVAGDYWVLIAQKHQISLDLLLGQNGATAEQPLYPGRVLCLPAEAQDPSVAPTTTPKVSKTTTAADKASTSTKKKSPPTTPAPSTTEAPAATRPVAPPTTAKPAPPTTKAAPPTTAKPAPATTVKPAPVHYGDGQIEAIIRAVWPDDLEDKALAIAWRESTYSPTVRNYCCYGLFQIYYDQHKKWLADIGVNSAEDLYDPQVNAYAALVLYQRSGGWGPWGG